MLYKKMKKVDNNGVTEIIGTMLLLGIAVSLFSVVFVAFMTVSPPPVKPYANVVFGIDEDNIVLLHCGGDPIDPTTEILMEIDGVSIKTTIGSNNGNHEFVLGEKIEIPYAGGSLDGKNISFSIVDKNSNSVVTMGDLRRENDVEVDISTYVNAIKSYVQPGPTLEITVFGDYRLSYVELWYDYSSDNFNWDGYELFVSDVNFPWYWVFNFPKGLGYYRFYSIGFSDMENEDAPSTADTECLYTHEPYISNPDPTDGAADISLYPDLSIKITDADGDRMDIKWYSNLSGTWSVINITSNVFNGTYSISTDNINEYEKTYYWKVVVNDSITNVESDTFEFTTMPPNTPPNIPFNPDPSDGASDVDIDSDLSWIGGDIDPGSSVTYDVYFGTSSSPSVFYHNISFDSYELETLSYNTTYYWKIVAYDNNDNRTDGPIWQFTTKEEPHWILLTHDDFDSGWGNFNDYDIHNSDCDRTNSEYYGTSGYSAHIQDDSGWQSTFYSDEIDASAYKSIKIDFWWMWAGTWSQYSYHNWYIKYYDGVGNMWYDYTWDVVLNRYYPSGYNRNVWYNQIVYINASSLPEDMRIKFECSAYDNYQDAYFDEIYVYGKVE